jgi:hypothetical protein
MREAPIKIRIKQDDPNIQDQELFIPITTSIKPTE